MLTRLKVKDSVGYVHSTDTARELISGTGADPRPRLRVDTAQTSFFEGREFRTYYEYSIPDGGTHVIRMVTPIDIIVFDQELSLDAHVLRMSVVQGGTAGGTWNALPIIGKNRMLSRSTPYYESVVQVSHGGTHTGGVELDVVRMRSDLQGNSQSTLSSGLHDERGMPPGEYFVKLAASGGVVSGLYKLWWEELQPSSSSI